MAIAPVARYKDLCIDSALDEKLGRFWAAALGLRFESDGRAGTLVGDVPEQRVWMNDVPEPKTVKNRVHIDVHASSLDELVALGATVLEPADEYARRWTVLADPEGGEFCAFVGDRDALPAYRLFELVIDAADPRAIATWWADVFGISAQSGEDQSYYWLDRIPGLPFESWDFVPVPEPKTVKNRIHWDVTVDSVDDLRDAGATVLRSPDSEITWTICADPEGNEFCAFTRS
jgi:predicted enzyme related to lactoylglutathione lyase